jgi:hypothetical protein
VERVGERGERRGQTPQVNGVMRQPGSIAAATAVIARGGGWGVGGEGGAL